MLKGARILSLDVCDYENNIVCNLYDNKSDISGQATNVVVRTERNGWKELSFTIPATCFDEDEIQPNYRLDYLIADYRIRLRKENEIDYYLISEPRINHNGQSKNVEVVAGHISQLLKTKNLGLEFSDEEGNNVGTAAALLQTILDGTGWTPGNVNEFYEDDGSTVKVRSLVASAKTGAFSLISNLCEKFDAKPIYHGDTRTVDIVPMNPFSEVEGSEIPQEVLDGKTVLEINYGKNASSITRVLNTENLVTRLYAYGAYGDKTNGMCSLQTVQHAEYNFVIPQSYTAGTEFRFETTNNVVYYFTATNVINTNTSLTWSDMDYVSRSYVWNSNQQRMYETYKEPKTPSYTTLTFNVTGVDNRFDYVMDFSYYDKIGLLTDNMKFGLAEFQRNMPSIVEAATEASTNFIQKEYELSQVAESNTGFLRLDVSSFNTGSNGELILNIRKTQYTDGVMYRSDYNEARRNYFSWYCAEALKENGEPTSGIGSVVYIIHNTTPITWEKAYVKYIDGESKTQDYSIRDATDPDTVTLWLQQSKVGPMLSSDRIYLFSTNSISGRLGVRESEIESLQQTLEQATKVVTEKHPTYFVWNNDPAPDLDAVLGSYGWYYRTFTNNTQFGELYFCYGIAGDTGWNRAIISEATPSVISGGYYFNLKSKVLYHGEASGWVNIAESSIIITGSASPYRAPNAEAKRLSQSFSKVAYYCLRHDMLYKGIYDEYRYATSADLAPGNYAFKNDYGFYWVFSTDETIAKNKAVWIDTQKYLVFQNNNVASIVTPEAKPYEAIDFPVANELSGVTIADGAITKTNGVEENSTTKQRTNHVMVYAGVTYQYSLPSNSYAVFYDSNRRYLDYVNLSTSGTFMTPARAKYARFVFTYALSSSNYLRVYNYQNKLFVKEVQYTILSPLTTSGEKTGIHDLIKLFADTADECYLTYLSAYQAAQEQVTTADDNLKNTLQDLYREGYWQKNEYVEGDEDKLYKDALENLSKISKPEATYDIQFLDLYSSNQSIGYSVTEDLDDVEWPDIEITDAVHLIDDEIDINCWAFIDRIEKCYDQPWRTRIVINTDLSLIAQHSFTDVLTRIAEVANETNAKQTIYKRAAAISGTGAYTADRLEGTIKANKTLFEGGMSNWRTDTKGNIIFESADGQSAMMLTGYGYCVANTKTESGDWAWRTFGTGAGISADEIVTGEMSASHIIAGTITSDLLHASVGQELEIGSNKALMLYATTDGFRPSGGLLTQVSNGDGTYRPLTDGDSYIQIAAKQGNNPAYINIMTGGIMNLQGSTMNLTANSTMNLTSGDMYVKADGQIHMQSGSDIDVESGATISVESGGDINVKGGGDVNIASSGRMNLQSGSTMYVGSGASMFVQSGGNMYVQSGGSINIQSGSTFTVNSTNFVIDEHGNVLLRGTIYAWAGNIAGFTIGGDQNAAQTAWTRQYMRTGNIPTVTTENNTGVYIGTDGLNVAGKLIFDASGNTAKLKISADNLIIGSDSFATITQNSVLESVRVYKTGTSSSTAPSLSQVNHQIDATWEEDVPSVSSSAKYLWSRLRIKTASGWYTYGTAVYEEELSTKMADSHKEYIRTNSTTAPSTSATGWSTSLPAPTKNTSGVETNPYVWVCTSVTYTNGNTERINIHRDTGLESLSSAAITATNIAAGITAVPVVDSTGISINGNTMQVKSTGQIQILGNASVYIGSSSSNSAVLLNKDGISIGSSGSIGIASQGTVTIGTNGSLFTISSNGTNASIRNGMTSLNDTTNNGVYLGTDGIALGKGAFKVTNAGDAAVKGSITATSGRIGAASDGTGGWIIEQNAIYADSKQVVLSTAGDYRFFAGNTTAANAAFYVKSDGTIKATKGTVGGWALSDHYIASITSKVGMYTNNEASTEISFWAGNSTPANAPFYVKADGTLQATSATVKGTIKADELYIDSTKATLSLDNSGKITLASLTQSSQNAITKAANISVTDGRIDLSSLSTSVVSDQNLNTKLSGYARITVTSGGTTTPGSNISLLTWDSLGNSSSNIELTPNKIRIGTNGTFEISSTNFSIDSSGNVTLTGTVNANDGEIGGWTIGTYRLYSNVSKNALSSYVELNCDPTQIQSGGVYDWTQPYAFWIGNSTASNAPFRVTRSGEVYITKLKVKKEDGTIEDADLFNPSLTGYRRVSDGAVIKSMSSDSSSFTISTTNGDLTVNFKKPAAINASWESKSNTYKMSVLDSGLNTIFGPTTLNPTEAFAKGAADEAAKYTGVNVDLLGSSVTVTPVGSSSISLNHLGSRELYLKVNETTYTSVGDHDWYYIGNSKTWYSKGDDVTYYRNGGRKYYYIKQEEEPEG